MCKGKLKTKSELLFDIILGPEKMLQGAKRIAWKSGRIHKVFKMLIFLSEIFPKKYQAEFMDELNMKDNNHQSIRKSNLTDHQRRNSYVSNRNSNILDEDLE